MKLKELKNKVKEHKTEIIICVGSAILAGVGTAAYFRFSKYGKLINELERFKTFEDGPWGKGIVNDFTGFLSESKTLRTCKSDNIITVANMGEGWAETLQASPETRITGLIFGLSDK